MASYNRCILLGNLTRDPEVKYTQGGTAVCEIGLAVNDKRKDAKGDWIEETTFVDVTLWGRTAEIAGEYLNKGSNVLIEGRLKLDSWEKDGQKRTKLRVVAENLRMLGGKQKSGSDDEYNQDAPQGRSQGGRGRSSGGSQQRRSAPPDDGEPAEGSARGRPPAEDGDIPF